MDGERVFERKGVSQNAYLKIRSSKLKWIWIRRTFSVRHSENLKMIWAWMWCDFGGLSANAADGSVGIVVRCMHRIAVQIPSSFFFVFTVHHRTFFLRSAGVTKTSFTFLQNIWSLFVDVFSEFNPINLSTNYTDWVPRHNWFKLNEEAIFFPARFPQNGWNFKRNWLSKFCGCGYSWNAKKSNSQRPFLL